MLCTQLQKYSCVFTSPKYTMMKTPPKMKLIFPLTFVALYFNERHITLIGIYFHFGMQVGSRIQKWIRHTKASTKAHTKKTRNHRDSLSRRPK